MPQVIKVFTPIKRVPTMIGKAQNGQKLPFGPYTLPQVASGIVLLLIASVLAMSLPMNPAITFGVGLLLTILVVFGVGLVPYNGVRMTSRIFWVLRLVFVRKAATAAGMPVTDESARDTVFVEESVVVLLPDRKDALATGRTSRNPPLMLPPGWAGRLSGSAALPEGTI